MNTNCLKGVMCPKCGNTERFDILCLTTATLTDDGVVKYDGAEFDGTHITSCPLCGHDGDFDTFCHPGFDVTFYTVTAESAEDGDTERRGWWMPGEWLHEEHPGEPAFAFDPDDYDKQEHDTLEDAIVEWAVGLLQREGACHPSCFPSDGADWWSTEPEVLSYETGEDITKSFHFQGFSGAAVAAINRRLADH